MNKQVGILLSEKFIMTIFQYFFQIFRHLHVCDEISKALNPCLSLKFNFAACASYPQTLKFIICSALAVIRNSKPSHGNSIAFWILDFQIMDA